MSSITSTNLSPILRELYAGQGVENVTLNKDSRPFYTMVSKMEDFEGDTWPCPVIWEDVGGLSTTFLKAQANSAKSQIAKFAIDIVEKHGVVQIENQAIMRSRSNRGAFVVGIKHVGDSILNRMANHLESSLFRSSTGVIGTIASSYSSGASFYLASIEDAVNFFVGQVLVCAADVATAPRNSAETATVTAVNLLTGYITTDGAITGMAAGDVLFNEGDYTAANDVLGVSGLPDWIPASAPGSTAFFGVARDADPVKLGGVRATGSTSDIEGAICDLASEISIVSPDAPDVAFCHPRTLRKLKKELGAKVERDDGQEITAGFQHVKVWGDRGLIRVVPAPFCQLSTIYLNTMKTWKLVSMGKAIQVDNIDGNDKLRVYNASAQEIRTISFRQLACNRPGSNGRVDLS